MTEKVNTDLNYVWTYLLVVTDMLSFRFVKHWFDKFFQSKL